MNECGRLKARIGQFAVSAWGALLCAAAFPKLIGDEVLHGAAEIVLGLAILASAGRRVGQLLAVFSLVVFLAILAIKVFAGDESCGCFGDEVELSPIVMASVDGVFLLVLAGCASLRVPRAVPTHWRATGTLLGVALAVILVTFGGQPLSPDIAPADLARLLLQHEPGEFGVKRVVLLRPDCPGCRAQHASIQNEIAVHGNAIAVWILVRDEASSTEHRDKLARSFAPAPVRLVETDLALPTPAMVHLGDEPIFESLVDR